MSNGFPYFQFCCDRWLTGKINAFGLDEQGLFLQFCMRAWVGKGPFTICSTLVQRQFNKSAEWIQSAIASFLDCGIMTLDGDQYRIKFIDAQLAELGLVREKRSAAGRASAEARRNSMNTEKSKKRREEKRREGCSTRVDMCSTHVDDGFASFWAAYPKKQGKQDAEKAWNKAKPPLDKCLSTIFAFKTSDQWTKEGGQFIPHPATWINRGQWDDEVPTKVSQPISGGYADPDNDPILKHRVNR